MTAPFRPLPLLALLTVLLVTGCQTPQPSPLDEPLVARFFLEARPGTAGVPVQLPVSRITLQVNPKPVLVEYDIVQVGLVRVDLGWCLQFQFTPAAARDLHRLSVSALGRRLVLTLNDTPIGARRIDQLIGEGALLIFVEVPDADLPPLAEQLKRTSAEIAKKAR
ncbi:MAG: hypothetical protein EXS42_03960 [Lacunisphaera sp.]|nr:hypothetical protein [Lacunisphaera sp.]